MKQLKILLALAALSLILAACSPFFQSSTNLLKDDAPNIDNGERIYFKADSLRAGSISFSDGPALGGMMMGSYLTCASCHGPTAQGGRHTMMMTVMDAPDIRYVALSSESDEHEEMTGDYDLATFKNAVINGQHPDGDSLDRNMPRWKMSDADLADIFEFLQSIN